MYKIDRRGGGGVGVQKSNTRKDPKNVMPKGGKVKNSILSPFIIDHNL